MTSDDMALVREYAQSNSEQAFATLVSKHVNLVYSVALRQVRDPNLAEEITQAVFIILAGKAKSLSQKTILSGWLCRTARYVSDRALRAERRRQFREQESHMQSTLDESESYAWAQFAPHLDEAMNCLGEKEHNAVVLRFFEGKELKESAAMGTGEDAARMRVNRGVEKLRKYFTKRGITLSAAMIAGAVSTYSVQAAPVGLAKAATAVAVTKGAAVSGSTLTLIKAALRIMAWTKVKTAAVVGASVLIVVGGATILPRHNEGGEPVYHGRTITDWLMNYPDYKQKNWREAEAALRAFGTNGIPYVMREFTRRDPLWRTLHFRTWYYGPLWVKTLVGVPRLWRFDNRYAPEVFAAIGPSSIPVLA